MWRNALTVVYGTAVVRSYCSSWVHGQMMESSMKRNMKCGIENKMYQTIFCYPAFLVERSSCGYVLSVHLHHHKDEQVIDRF